ncbi:MAG TPA: agmatine deiminase [Eubacterium sp.]|nr:agmatine deiminase [Eubacterium sp.]
MRKDGFRMPAEYEEHEGTIMIWPVRPGSWGKNPHRARIAFAMIISELLKHEKVWLIIQPDMSEDDIYAYVKPCDNLILLRIKTSDSWARDVSPIYVVDEEGNRRGIKFAFNAWGGEVDGLYEDYEADDAMAERFCELVGHKLEKHSDFVLEGGSIHTNGCGKLLSTRACLLSKGRNPSLSEKQIEEYLLGSLGGDEFVWITRGIYNDETNEHVDNMCAFIGLNEVVLASCENKNDPQYEMSKLAKEELVAAGLKVHELPVPEVPVLVVEEDMENYVFAKGEDNREVGERLAASYINFYMANSVALVPQFGGENEESDKKALEILRGVMPDREVIGIPARDILLGGGNIHCITMQVPAERNR